MNSLFTDPNLADETPALAEALQTFKALPHEANRKLGWKLIKPLHKYAMVGCIPAGASIAPRFDGLYRGQPNGYAYSCMLMLQNSTSVLRLRRKEGGSFQDKTFQKNTLIIYSACDTIMEVPTVPSGEPDIYFLLFFLQRKHVVRDEE